MKTITIKNFGPIKDVTIELKKLTLLIGPQAGGKSVIAKLVSMFSDPEVYFEKEFVPFLQSNNIDYPLSKESVFEYQSGNYKATVKGTQFNHNHPYKRMNGGLKTVIRDVLKDQFKIDHPDPEKLLFELFRKRDFKKRINWTEKECIYIPAERNLFVLLTEKIFSLSHLQRTLFLPSDLIKFGYHYETARDAFSKGVAANISFIKSLNYSREKNKDFIEYKEVKTPLSQGSSGFKSAIPLALVCLNSSKEGNSQFIIEEPEQNLYPETQYELIKFLTETSLSKDNRLLVTTHSPYILTAFSNLMQAHNTAKKDEVSTMKIVRKKHWIDFKNVSAYYIDKGTCRNILDRESRLIDANAIDKASDAINKEFDKLLEIENRK